MKIANWGNYPVVEAEMSSFSSGSELRGLLAGGGQAISRGLGRCYGDASLAKRIFSTHRFNRLLSFDAENGLLSCESGVSLAELLAFLVPRGWFPPVVPGTKFITVGGAVAADIHGKNHHGEGSFGYHLRRLELLLADGRTVTCSPEENPDWFRATCGGMGLTGVILSATFRLKPVGSAYILRETQRVPELEAVMDLFECSGESTYSVAWLDNLARGTKLGRSVMYRGEHARADQLPPALGRQPLRLRPPKTVSVPLFLPSLLLNRLSMKAFNGLVYHGAPRRAERSIVDYDRFFFPLDRILHWNRIYGRRGFLQYQFVLPIEAGRKGMRTILEHIAGSGEGSFLTVLKLFGPQTGLLSFPMPGYTLALDFPAKPSVLKLLGELDRMVADYGGRIYLAKDARMKAEAFFKGYPEARTFMECKKRLDPEGRWASFQSRRIEVTQ